MLKAKFEQVIGAGVRQIAVLADDAANYGDSLYINLMTELVKWVSSDEMQEKYPGLKTTIPFCPVQYGGNGALWMSNMPDEVPIVMTGGRVWGEVTDNFTNTFYQNVGRGPYMWINWPCTDNSKRHLIMGGYTTFLHPGVSPEKIQGIVLNPMQQSEPSKVAIFGNACYSWNIWTEQEADQAWEDSFKYVDHETYVETDASNALKELSKHMINQNMDSRVTVLQESEDLKDQLNTFKSKLSSNALTSADIEAMRGVFQLLADASKTYREEGNTRIAGQIVYWLDTWDDITAAADLLLNALDAYYVNNNAGIVPDYYTQAQAKLEEAETHGFWYVNHREYAEVGVQHIMPFLRTVRDHVATLAQLTVDPTKVITTPIWSFGDFFWNGTKLANLHDGKENTETVSSEEIKSGDYVGLTFSRGISIDSAVFLTGRSGNLADTFGACKLEYTTDGTTWQTVEKYANLTGSATNHDFTFTGLELKNVRGLRMTATANNAKWLGVREIYINEMPEKYEIKITWGNVSPLIYEIALIPRGVLAVDKTQLASLVEQCEEIVQQDESKYDATALSAYREARKAAQDILAGTVQSQAQVNEAYAKLNSAHRALLQSVNDLSTAKEQLNALKNSYNETEYTPNSWTTFTTSGAYQNVVSVLAGNNLTAIKAATQALLDKADNTLQRRGDLTKLNELLASIEKLNASDYTAASYEALQDVVKEAKALVADAANATDAAIDAMVQELTAAVENLERKPAPSRPSTTSKYTLRFVTNGGSALEPITAIKGTTIKLKDYVTTREGYTFAGWYADAALTERITEVTLNASTSIYAKWTKNGMPFTDVKVGTWYYDAVAFVYENGLMQGTSATRFSPDSSLTRAMLAQILYNRAGKPTVKEQSAFTDVANDAWYADAVIWAYGEGIVSGVGGGKFAPDASITREQLSAMLYRAAGSPEGKETTLPFTDASKVSSYAKSAICWAVEEGIVTGKGAGRLDPTGTATRAEVAQMLARFEQS